MEERERLAKQLEEEKKNLEEATTNLKGDLMVRGKGVWLSACFTSIVHVIEWFLYRVGWRGREKRGGERERWREKGREGMR